MFWRWTPKQFTKRVRLWRRQQEREDYRAGLIASQVIRPHLKKNAKPPQPLDWFGGKSRQRPPDTITDMPKTEEERKASRAEFLAWASTLGSSAIIASPQ